MRTSLIDHISDTGTLVDCAPKYEDMFEGIQDLKSQMEEAKKISSACESVGMTRGGNLMRIACFPHDLYVAICEVNPFFLKDKREFYSWLSKNPFYRVGRSIAR